MTIDEINKSVREELIYQEWKWGAEFDRKHGVGEWILLLEAYAEKSKYAWVGNKGDQAALREVVKLTALCFSCLRQHGYPELTAH